MHCIPSLNWPLLEKYSHFQMRVFIFLLKPLIVATEFCSHFHGFKIKQDLHAEELLLTLKSLTPTFQLI